MTETRSVFLQDGDVVLRPVEKEDAEFLRDLSIHPEVRDTIGRAPKPRNIKQTEEVIEEIKDSNDRRFVIEYQGERAGDCSIVDIDSDFYRGEIGISVHPEMHNQGIGSKTVQLLLKYGFETLNLHCIRGGYLEGNEASRRIMEKAGMKEEGTKRDYKLVQREWKDVIYMSILESEYRG